MAYLLGTTIPDNKIIIIALRKVPGIGLYKSKSICSSVGLTFNTQTFDLGEKQKHLLIQFIEKSDILLRSDLIRSVSDSRKRLVTLRIFRGIRSKQGFPIRGQRTHTNGKTAKRLK
jgi:small subunit ribosomal protein S13